MLFFTFSSLKFLIIISCEKNFFRYKSITLMKNAFENTMFTVTQVIFKQYLDFINYVNHDIAEI